MIVKAASTAKKVLKFIPAVVAAGTVGFAAHHAGPCLKHQEKSDKSLNYWAGALSKCSHSDLLLKHGIVPDFVINGRYESSGRPVLASALSSMNVELALKLMEAGTNFVGFGHVDFFLLLGTIDHRICHKTWT